MRKLLILLLFLATKVTYAHNSAMEPRESQFDKHPECMNRGTDTSTSPCIVNDDGVLPHLRPRMLGIRNSGIRQY
jgi:hypothetical protein